jgi:carbamoyl-phosphate synthase large subunit
MPRRTDLRKICLIGSGPIVIGQACEFDYSGTQACKALRAEGYEVVLVNSNPATIMTDPDMADRTYIEPITPDVLELILERERPDALLPTVGGQTALNAAMALHKRGTLKRLNIEMIGANAEVIDRAEDREQFKQTMLKIGVDVPASGVAKSLSEAHEIRERVGLPCVLRPSFTLGGTGGGIAYNREEFTRLIELALELSPVHEVLIEESVIGWKEYELEVVRDRADNVIIVCSIENVDPMGVHTGDSITVAPIQTLSDKEYQRMRDAAIRIIRAIGVECGGSNIQFATDPASDRMIAIEMNPRVSRSSALASKATGFPIAKIAAKLAVGYTLDELKNDITKTTPASFEPTIDYVVTKVPRWNFEKFQAADATLTTQMKSVGETMAIGRTFAESLQKALRGLETGRFGIGCDRFDRWGTADQPNTDEIATKLATPNAERIWFVRYAMLSGMSIEEIHAATKIDPWFLYQIADIIAVENELRGISSPESMTPAMWLRAKQYGFSDPQLAIIWHKAPNEIRRLRKAAGVEAVFKLVDTCAAEFEAVTPYYYSTYEAGFVTGESQVEDETRPPSDKKRILILGGGPNRIGQGIEFDYCCVQAAFALHEAGFETIMVNSNPETVSTDYDTSDHLFFEPLTIEDVLNVCDRMKPAGAIVQFGGQTPLNLARGLEIEGVAIIGTSVDSIDCAEDRERFTKLVGDLGLEQPPSGHARDVANALIVARRIGYPVLVRPSYVLGGRAMEIVYDESSMTQFVEQALAVSLGKPVLIDKFLESAIEVDVDCVCDGRRAVIGGVMQHIEEAGIHSGDSACVLPPHTLPPKVVEEIKRQTRAMALALNVKGLMNVQFAVTGNRESGTGNRKDEFPRLSVPGSRFANVCVLEVNPRASRTVPFVSKATGVALAKIATLVMVGKTLDGLGVTEPDTPKHFSVKESVFPFNKFLGVDIILGPEMRSTGEVMGIAGTMAAAFAKSQLAALAALPNSGTVFVSVANRDKPEAVSLARDLAAMDYQLMATRGTATMLRQHGIGVTEVRKVLEGRPNLVDYMKNGRVNLVINTPSGRGARSDEAKIRATAVQHGIPCITTLAAAHAAVEACRTLRDRPLSVRSLQELHANR